MWWTTNFVKMDSCQTIKRKDVYVVVLLTLVWCQATHTKAQLRARVFTNMGCNYMGRGSLTTNCMNATAEFFRNTNYAFDHFVLRVNCLNCSLNTIPNSTFDITGNAIQTLDLTTSNISIIEKQAFVGLMFLKKLLMPYNNIRSIYPGTFLGTRNIEYLDLESNSIQLLADDAFMELVHLKQLNLKNNSIRRIEKQAFNGLVNLKELNLKYNQLENLTNVFNGNLSTLNSLDLAYNRIWTMNQSDFKSVENLVKLDLSSNLLDTIPKHSFIYLNNLKLLDLSRNPISSILPGSFEGLKNLQTLNLMDANIVEIPPKTWQGLYNLKELVLAYNEILNFRSEMYSFLPELTKVNLSHNQITSFENTGLFSLPLHVLDLSYNNVSSVDAPSLVKYMPKLYFLSFEFNPLTCNSASQLQRFYAAENFKLVLHVPENCDVIEHSLSIDRIREDEKDVQTENNLAEEVEKYLQAKFDEEIQKQKNAEKTEHNHVVIYVLLSFCFISLVAMGVVYVYREMKHIGVYKPAKYSSRNHVRNLSNGVEMKTDVDLLY